MENAYLTVSNVKQKEKTSKAYLPFELPIYSKRSKQN